MIARRGVLVLAFCIGLPLIGAPSACAWSNGEDGYDLYGTHDWVLDQARDALGDRVDWVCRSAALRATDDSDSKDNLDHASSTWWHVRDEGGSTYGGAPEAVEVWFDRAQTWLEPGQKCSASGALDIMAHLLGDVAQPMHTDGRLAAEDRVHGAYESAVDSRSEVGDMCIPSTSTAWIPRTPAGGPWASPARRTASTGRSSASTTATRPTLA